MKTQMAVLCALAQGASVAQARIGQRFTAESDDMTFYIDYSSSGSSNPYSILFRQNGVRSKYRFRMADGFTRKLNIGDLRYSAVYRSRDDSLKRINDLNDRRALLAEDVDEDEDNMTHAERRLAVLTCDDCSTIWDLLCEGGMDTLCDEIEYGVDPLVDQSTVEDSIYTMCYTFRPMCDTRTGDEVCADQCEECDRALTFSLEWDNRDTDMDLYVTEPDGTVLKWNNMEGNFGFLDQDSISGGPEIYRLYSGLSTSTSGVLGEYTAVARLTNNRGDADSVNWVLTAQMNGETVWTESGEFTENSETSEDFTYTLSTYIDNGCDNETLQSIIAVEGDNEKINGR